LEEEVAKLRQENRLLQDKVQLLQDILIIRDSKPKTTTIITEHTEDNQLRREKNHATFIVVLLLVVLFVQQRKLTNMQLDKLEMHQQINEMRQKLMDNLELFSMNLEKWGNTWRVTNRSVRRKMDDLLVYLINYMAS